MINAEDIATQWINPGEWPARILKGKVQKITRKERRSETMAGLFASMAVEIPRTEYAELLRESEQLNTIRNLVKKKQYISMEDLKTILCIEDEEAPEEEKSEKQCSFAELLGEEGGE